MGEEAEWKRHLQQDGPFTYRIRKHGMMQVDARLVSDKNHLQSQADDRSPGQLVNAASLPGAVGEAWGMADWHFGYGFPIGGVVATDADYGEQGGAISPGGVGFDINCGVRLLKLDIEESEIGDLKGLARDLAKEIPAGASGKGGVGLREQELQDILNTGAKAAVELGWGLDEDLDSIESKGILHNEGDAVSERSLQRGIKSLGTLGSGNHFLELQVVDSLVDEKTAQQFGLREGQVCMMIHSGSRGLGHQVCSEHVDTLEREYRQDGNVWYSEKWDWKLPDRQLAAAPVHSKEGQSYIEAMNAAGNFAFANRSALAQRARNVLQRHLGRDGDASLLYDVCHNIAKFEEHTIHGSNCNCLVHRKGATRALAGNSNEMLKSFPTGQPVLVPGDMGTASWVMAGPIEDGSQAFSSNCHGAGRALSRSAARRIVDGKAMEAELAAKGITVHAKTRNILSEEAPQAYKDVDEVIRLSAGAGLARPVARLRPLAVIKG